MDEEEFRKRGEEMVDYVADYLDSISQRSVAPDVEPGYLITLLPSSAPKEGVSFEKIMKDVESFIMPGIAHWQHPNFHAYFSSCTSYPSILAEMVSDTIGSVGFNWDISPAGTDLEVIVVDWLGEMMGLPHRFLHFGEGSGGGGIIQNTSSECILITMLTARNDAFKRAQERNPHLNKGTILSSLIAYCSNESHSCVEKAAMISMVTIKVLDTDEDFRLRGETVERAIEEDKKNGLVPFYLSCTLGTTACCACDPIDEIGPVCESNEIWLNVDAAYGGSALICPEFRPLLEGIEYASSLNVNAAKWFLVSIDCAVMFVTDRLKIHDSAVVDLTSLGYNSDEDRWGHPVHRRFRALKLWFVMRCYGAEGLREHIRNHCRLARLFESSVKSDDRFEVLTCRFGLVCFRMRGSNTMNKKLLMTINASSKLHLIACSLGGLFVIRFCICSPRTTDDDIVYAVEVITGYATELLRREMSRYTDTDIEQVDRRSIEFM